MKMDISVQIKNVYGVSKIYPICEKARTFTKMLHQATLTEQDVANIKQLGFTVFVSNPLPATL